MFKKKVERSLMQVFIYLIQKFNVAILKLMICCSFTLIYGEYSWMHNWKLAFRLLINKASQFAYQTWCCWHMLIGLVFESIMPVGCKSCIYSVLLECNKRAHYAFLMHFSSYKDKFGSLFTFSFGRGGRNVRIIYFLTKKTLAYCYLFPIVDSHFPYAT